MYCSDPPYQGGMKGRFCYTKSYCALELPNPQASPVLRLEAGSRKMIGNVADRCVEAYLPQAIDVLRGTIKVGEEAHTIDVHLIQ